jgi:D-alanyl-D-alanine carboxypeptidase
MDNWLKPALDYTPQWLEYQLHDTEQPGCVIAVAHKARIVLERAFGFADLVSR